MPRHHPTLVVLALSLLLLPLPLSLLLLPSPPPLPLVPFRLYFAAGIRAQMTLLRSCVLALCRVAINRDMTLCFRFRLTDVIRVRVTASE